jgi:beta-lactam-binding protein with PASTA domain
MGERTPAAPSREGLDTDPATETTRAEGDWPVSALYQITPEPEQEVQADVGDRRTRRQVPEFPGGPSAAIAAAVLAALLLVGAGTAWLVFRPDTGSAAHGTGAQTRSPKVPPTHPGKKSEAAAPATASPATSTNASQKTQEVVVPNVAGLAADDASARLRAAGLEPRSRPVESSRPAGTVIRQDPSASAVDRGAVVDLQVAKKRVATEPVVLPTRVAVPSLVGSTAAAAKSRLRALGLHWSTSEVASGEPRGTVVRQTPSPGAQVEKGRTVILAVSSGPARVTVPDVTGVDEQTARESLETAGFEVRVLDQPTSDPAEEGTVVEQDPVGEAEAEKGSVVTITVARLG